MLFQERAKRRLKNGRVNSDDDITDGVVIVTIYTALLLS